MTTDGSRRRRRPPSGQPTGRRRAPRRPLPRSDINALRRDIDRLDEALLKLLNRRAQKVLKIGLLKRRAAALGRAAVHLLPYYDPARERQVLDRLAAANRGPLPPAAVQDIFAAILAAHRLLEKQLMVAFYGPSGSFTHIAARRKFGAADLRPVDAIADVFANVAKKEADLGVVPIENTTAGVVPLTLDELMESKLKILAEIYVDIEHHLLTHCRSLSAVKRVYSHPSAIAQCRIWLKANLPGVEVIPVGNTARAAELAAAEREAAAIAPALAGELYSLPALASRIHDQPDNRTRFFVIGHQSAPPSGRDKTSLVFSLPHRAGSLHRALGALSKHQVNMTFIQSHPTKQTPWEYMFFVDVQGHAEEPQLTRALADLRECTLNLRVLGSYPEAE
jgi:chorismate mutase/prephenate dehydratase